MSSDSGSDDGVGPSFSLGLNKVLQDAGVDISEFTSAFDKTGGAGHAQARAFAEVEDADDNAQYMDDDADGDDGETAEERAARARAAEKLRADEARWMAKGLEIQRAAEAAARRKVEARKRKQDEGKEMTPLQKIQMLWPDWAPGGRIRFSEVFYETPVVRAKEEKECKKRKLLHFGMAQDEQGQPKEEKTYNLSIAPSAILPPEAYFRLRTLPDLNHDPDAPIYQSALSSYFDPEWIREAKQSRRDAMVRPPGGMDVAPYHADLTYQEGWGDTGRPLDLMPWESEVVTLSLPPEELERLAGQDGERRTSLSLKIKKPGETAKPEWKQELKPDLRPRNDILASDIWAKEIIWDATRISPELFTDDEEREVADAAQSAVPAAAPDTSSKTAKLDPYNMSNDHIYAHTREARFKIRQTFGAIEVFHSTPAKALQLPFYKTSLSKHEARSWKRPSLQFPVGVSVTFSKLKANPAGMSSRKKALADPSERFKSTKDLTMAEKGTFVLLEFSEEYPPIMSGYGMGTTMVNYYRKKDDSDSHVPELDFGQPSIINTGDGEPFTLGFVDKGKVTQVIHNNLIRAPIFRHTPETSDFLVIRHTVNGHQQYFIRAISNLYTVGQTVPNESEVPGPHARKNTSYARIRLQIVAWLLINRDREKRIKIGKLLKYFPDQSELQMRQRLKVKGQEFLVYNRSHGANQGYWQLNPAKSVEWPEERQEVLEQATPEQAMLYEAMQVGARHLYDAGYTKTAEGKDVEGDDENGLDIEQKLAVWSTTLNYKRAETGKAWLVVHGDGDPTGRGEGWSFLKANMKGYFLRRGETEQGRRIEAEIKANGNTVKISNAEQNRIYDEEKRRIWDLQASALSSSVPPELEARDDDTAYASASAGTPMHGYNHALSHNARYARADSRRAFSRSNSMAATPFYGVSESPAPGRDGSPALSADESTFTGHNPLANKVLRIKRIVKGKQVVEIIKDPAVIASYRRRVEDRQIESYKTKIEELAPTGDTDSDNIKRLALSQELENLRKNQQRRAARRKYAAQQKSGVILDVADPMLGEGANGDGTGAGADTVTAGGQRKCGACGRLGHTKANRHCPEFKYNQFTGGPPPPEPTSVGSTPGMMGMTPGAYGGADYFAMTGSGEAEGETPGQTGKYKIRLGGFGR